MDRAELDKEMALRAKHREIQRELRAIEVARRDAQIAHALTRSNDYALATVKAAGVTSAAGVAALLGFVSANSAKLVGLVDDFRTCMLLFVGGMLASGIAAGLAYLSEGMHAKSLEDFEVLEEQPFIKDNEPDWLGWWSRVFACTAIVAIIAAFGLFLAGAWHFKDFVSSAIFPALR